MNHVLDMRYKIIVSIFFVVLFLLPIFSVKPAKASDGTQKESLLQKIQILQQEIAHLLSLASSSQSKKEITAASYLAVNLSDNSAVLEKNADKPYPIASITKLMNAVVASENINIDQTITLTEKMLKPSGHSPTLFSGLIISAKNLLQASLIQSTNDASESLSYFLGNQKFLDLMNRKTKELNMANTVFYDVHGLNPSNRSTASDMVKLLTYIYKNHPEILTITKGNDFWLPDATGKLLKFQNVNNFYDFPQFIGGKTGYLPEAKQTFASLFSINNEPVAIVLLYSSNRQSDIFRIIDKLKK